MRRVFERRPDPRDLALGKHHARMLPLRRMFGEIVVVRAVPEVGRDAARREIGILEIRDIGLQGRDLCVVVVDVDRRHDISAAVANRLLPSGIFCRRGDEDPTANEVVVPERAARRDIARIEITDALPVFNKRTDIDGRTETGVRDIRYFDRHPVATAGRRDQLIVRAHGRMDRGGLVDRAAAGPDRRVAVGFRENEADAGIAERADREQETQVGALRRKRVARHSLVTEVLHLRNGFPRRA